MPMLDLQRRHAQVFRLRLGETQGNRPVKLTEAIKVTSPGEEVVQAFVNVYGGTVTPFNGNGSKDRFGALLPVTSLPIMVLPGASLDQWWESYAKSVCQRRCDGETEQLSGKACQCPADLDVRMATKGACRPMTRLNVLCPDVAVVGAGSLVSHGRIAAETLPQSIAVAEAALSRGIMVPGILRVVEHKGRNHYVIPQIEIVGVSLRTLATGEVPSAIAAPSVAALPAPKSAQGATTTEASVKEEGPTESDPPPSESGPVGTTGRGDGGVTAPPAPSTRQSPAQRAAQAAMTRVAKALEFEDDKELRDEVFHAVLRYCTNGRVTSLKDLTDQKDANNVQKWLEHLRKREAHFYLGNDGLMVIEAGSGEKSA